MTTETPSIQGLHYLLSHIFFLESNDNVPLAQTAAMSRSDFVSVITNKVLDICSESLGGIIVSF